MSTFFLYGNIRVLLNLVQVLGVLKMDYLVVEESFSCPSPSFSPSSGVMNPNPLELLKNFTVPLPMIILFLI